MRFLAYKVERKCAIRKIRLPSKQSREKAEPVNDYLVMAYDHIIESRMQGVRVCVRAGSTNGVVRRPDFRTRRGQSSESFGSTPLELDRPRLVALRPGRFAYSVDADPYRRQLLYHASLVNPPPKQRQTHSEVVRPVAQASAPP